MVLKKKQLRKRHEIVRGTETEQREGGREDTEGRLERSVWQILASPLGSRVIFNK